MKDKKNRTLLFMSVMVMLMLCTACSKNETKDTHAADPSHRETGAVQEDSKDSEKSEGAEGSEEISLDSYKAGKWTQRSCALTNVKIATSEADAAVSINMYEKLTEEEITSIVNYYWQEVMKDGKDYIGKKINACYFVFYQGDKFDVSRKIKISHGEKSDITQEDESRFDTIVELDKEEAEEAAEEE